MGPCYAHGRELAINIDNFKFEHNTYYQSSGGRALSCSSSGYSFLTLRNNIFRVSTMGGTPGTHTHNLYSSTPSYSLGTGEKVGDARFVNAGAKDFSLQDGSPAIDAGLDLGYTEDFEDNPVPQGTVPDMGAFDPGSSGPPPPNPPPPSPYQ